MKYLKRFEELSSNDYRNDDPISKLKMIEIIYDTIMQNDNGDTFSISQVEDQELDMESAEINFKYQGVPFKISIERVENGVKECAVGGLSAPGSPNVPSLPRKSTVGKIKKFGKKAGLNKSIKSSGGRNALGGKIETHESTANDDFVFFGNNNFLEITIPIPSKDFELFEEIINKGIDSHLEGFVKSDFSKNGNRAFFKFHKSEIDILLRRLQEMWEASDGDDQIYQWIEDIKNYYKD